MREDKAIKAADDAYCRAPGDRMRAALAAADKVRARGFNFEAEASAFLDEVDILSSSEPVVELMAGRLRCAFAAGLAKGEADRAALVEALTEAARRLMAAGLDGASEQALALVRKGV